MAPPTDGRILVVEDDEVFGALVCRHLEARGYAVDLVGTTREATELLDAGRRPWLVLLDINLPDESGWSLIRAQAYRAAGTPPVIVVSATRVSPARLRDYGVAGYLPKPFAMETLLDILDRRSRSAPGPAFATAIDGSPIAPTD